MTAVILSEGQVDLMGAGNSTIVVIVGGVEDVGDPVLKEVDVVVVHGMTGIEEMTGVVTWTVKNDSMMTSIVAQGVEVAHQDPGRGLMLVDPLQPHRHPQQRL